MNKLKFVALAMSIFMMAGCAGTASSSSEEATTQPEDNYVPVYTYVNPDPDMILISNPNGEDITYKNYRLYLDVGSEMDRYAVRQDMGVVALLEKDFPEMGIEIDEADWESYAAQELVGLIYSSPTLANDFDYLAELVGVASEDVLDSIALSFRSKYLANLAIAHFDEQAQAEFPYVEFERATEIQALVESGAAEADIPEDLSKAYEEWYTTEQTRQQEVYNLTSKNLSDYSLAFNERLTFENDDVVATLDGEDIPYTDEIRTYINYYVISSRIDTVAFIQSGELSLQDLNSRNIAIDNDAFEESYKSYFDYAQSDETVLATITDFCAKFGATADDYFSQLRNALLLQQVGETFYLDAASRYEAIAEGEEKPATSDEYYTQEIDRVLEGSEVVNVLG